MAGRSSCFGRVLLRMVDSVEEVKVEGSSDSG